MANVDHGWDHPDRYAELCEADDDARCVIATENALVEAGIDPDAESPVKCAACDGTGIADGEVSVAGDGRDGNGTARTPSSRGRAPGDGEWQPCPRCGGDGWFGIDPAAPLPEIAGSHRIPFFQVRYNRGVD